MASLMLVAILATLGCVAAYPSSVGNKGITEDVKYTKEFIAKELQKTDLEPKLLMEYLAHLMGIDSESQQGQDDPCINGDSVLNVGELGSILNGVTAPVTYHYSTYIVRRGETTLEETHPLHGYQTLYNIQLRSSSSVPSNLWMNFSPCKVCTRLLINNIYNKRSKPTIHYAQLYATRITENNTAKLNVTSAVESVKCLVRLVKNGFSVEVWNWEGFRDNYITAQHCKDRVTTTLGTTEFDKAYKGLKKINEFILQLANRVTSIPDSWCPLV